MANYDKDLKAIFGIIAVGIALWMIFGGIMRCAGFKGGDIINNAPMEYRHSD